MPQHRLAAVIMVALLSGCYRYVPTAAGDLSSGSRVRIDVPTSRPVSILTDSGPATYRNVGVVRGHVVARRGDTLVLRESYLIPADDPGGQRALRGEVSFLAETTDGLYRRRLDRAATTFAVVVPIGVIAYFLANLEWDADY
jgi:hypothetical protein